jgi:glycolate oxidase FAD binding subunit
LSDALREIVGADHVRPASAGDAVRGVAPQFVVEPADGPQLAAVLARATERGLSVVPRGGGTKLEWGNPPRRADIVVSTARLDRILEHAWSDLTVTVQAGCTIQTLQEALRARGQRVAVDPLWPDRATVGGVLSTNDTGALRLRFGGLRDFIIGSTLALPDGTLASSGGKVVKNVAGYDLSKLATGAMGTLGVVTTAIFRLHPLPQQSRTLSAAGGSLDAVQRAIDALQDSKLAHSALQVRASSSTDPVMDILFEGSSAGIDAQARQAQALAGSLALEVTPPAAWRGREALWTGSESVLKIATLPADLSKALQHIQRLAETVRVEWAAVFQATGLGWLRIGEAGARWADLVRQLRQFIDGSVTVLRPPARDAGADSWADPGDAQALMAAVKQQFDPASTLNPGRFVGGL